MLFLCIFVCLFVWVRRVVAYITPLDYAILPPRSVGPQAQGCTAIKSCSKITALGLLPLLQAAKLLTTIYQ